MRSVHQIRRKIVNNFMISILFLCATIALFPLLSVLFYVISHGWPALNFSFFTQLPKPVGEIGGGMANAFLGSLTVVAMASLIGIPWGVLIGVYLSEYGRGKRATTVRFGVDMLASVPSIVIGLFVYALMVRPMHRFSAMAGAVALAIIMVPTVAKVTEEILKMVPTHIREAGLSLGLPRWKVILRIVLQSNMGAILTGVMLSIARVAGETAPLLFTALNNRFWQNSLDQPIASVPVQIYNYAISPYDDWHNQAWAGALVLVVFVFALNLFVRAVIKTSSEQN